MDRWRGVRAALLVTALVVGGTGASALPALADQGPWAWPLAGPQEVSRPFAPPESRYGSGHRGADLPSSPGAVVRAAGAGRVSYAGLLAGRGVVVVVHGALRTTYEPVTASVPVGAVVALGEPIGTLAAGHAGCPVDACLHWGLRRGDAYLDPVRLVERAPVRLLPLGEDVGAGTAPAARPAPAAPPAGAVTGSSVRAALERASTRTWQVGPAPAAAAPEAPGGTSPALSPVADERDLPLTALAVAALVAGVALLARWRPSPPGPVGAPAGAALAVPAGVPPSAEAQSAAVEQPAPAVPVARPADDGPVAGVVELETERLRRRTG